MPPIDWPSVLIAVFSALVTWLWHRGTQPSTPASPAGPPALPDQPVDVNHPLIQALLVLLKQALEKEVGGKSGTAS